MAVKSENLYPISIRIIHWVSAFLLVATVMIVMVRDQLDTKALRLELLNLHRELGLIILCLVLVRIFLKVKYIKHIPNHGLSLINELAARIAHLLIYGSLMVLPMLGLLQTNASGKPASFFGLFPLPKLIGENEDFAELLQDYHAYLAWILVAIVMVHLLAALWHHFFLKDSVFESMKIKFK